MSKKEIAVRTIYLQKFFDPGREMVSARQNPQDMQALVKAMRRLEMADKMLEKELTGCADKGYDIASVLQHPHNHTNEHDLLITLILSREVDS